MYHGFMFRTSRVCARGCSGMARPAMREGKWRCVSPCVLAAISRGHGVFGLDIDAAGPGFSLLAESCWGIADRKACGGGEWDRLLSRFSRAFCSGF